MKRWTRLRAGKPVRLDLGQFKTVKLEPHCGLDRGKVWTVDADPDAGFIWLVQDNKLESALLVTATINVDGTGHHRDLMLEGCHDVDC